jgi:hypothetical protein
MVRDEGEKLRAVCEETEIMDSNDLR